MLLRGTINIFSILLLCLLMGRGSESVELRRDEAVSRSKALFHFLGQLMRSPIKYLSLIYNSNCKLEMMDAKGLPI